jgi:hypothetical protein
MQSISKPTMASLMAASISPFVFIGDATSFRSIGLTRNNVAMPS